ncbi:hypothetical protein C7212DRAFT_354290 [Tuber magnatum]|uniref:Uncharacterized protein n=1 Tax=Tuber magnatum TaxID=42249 RepID=A0A317SHY3_9PEZI|nr:hypothetical protein C7212DRAFT_354290 [Tuber magnatum]
MPDEKVYSASATTPVNIAVVKYWGKRDTKLNLPTNPSLPQAELTTHTTANLEDANPSLSQPREYCVHAISEDNFPTAAGLTSSAPSFAALVRAIPDLYELPELPTQLSRFGGYVADSYGVEVALASHWLDMKAVTPVVPAEKKVVSATASMQATAMKAAIGNRDFEQFAAHTMADSKQFHAMNGVSRAAIRPNAVISYQAREEEKVHGFLGAFLAPEVAEWAGKYAMVPPEGYDTKPPEPLKNGVRRVISPRAGEAHRGQ